MIDVETTRAADLDLVVVRAPHTAADPAPWTDLRRLDRLIDENLGARRALIAIPAVGMDTAMVAAASTPTTPRANLLMISCMSTA